MDLRQAILQEIRRPRATRIDERFICIQYLAVDSNGARARSCLRGCLSRLYVRARTF
jgi:hypothetical protein